MNFQELKNKIEEFGIKNIGRAYIAKDTQDFLTANNLSIVLSEGGHEGDGEHVERVFKYNGETEDTFFRISGFYSSYEGTEWDEDIVQVYPHEVTITVYKETN